MDKPDILDVFIYNGEPIAEFRMSYLAPYVDGFVVVEARKTFTNRPKSCLHLERNKDMFDKYEYKKHLIKIVIEEFPETDNVWEREAYARNCAREVILEVMGDRPFLAMVCDADEIPRDRVVQDLPTIYDQTHEGLRFQMKLFKYGFRWMRDVEWYHAYVVSDKGVKQYTLNDLRLKASAERFIENGGWHVSYCGTVSDMVSKLESFSHTEYDKPEFKKRDYIKTCMLTGRFFLNIDEQDKLVPCFGEDLPTGWQDFQAKIDALIFEDEQHQISGTSTH
jgi:hypothetical protein